MNAETMLRGSPMLAMVLPEWNELALRCAWFELKVRLVAGETHPGESVSNGRLGGDNGLLSLIFGTRPFDAAQQELLRSCVRVRNKVVHCEPDALLRELQKVDPTFSPPPTVTQLSVDGAQSGAEIREALETRRNAVAVQDTNSRKEGFFGWMLEAKNSGIFDKAIEVMERGINTLARQSA